MSERPFMQLYVSDYLGDTLHLTAEQHGIYLLLLMAMWQCGGYLPNDKSSLSRIGRIDPRRWHLVSSEVMALLQVKDGKVTSARLLREIEKARSKSLERARAGAAGGRSKSLKFKDVGLANATVLPEQNPSIFQRPDNQIPDGVYKPKTKTKLVVDTQAIRLASDNGQLALDDGPNLGWRGDNGCLTNRQLSELEQDFPGQNIRGAARRADAVFGRRKDKRHTFYSYLVACLEGQDRDARGQSRDRQERAADPDRLTPQALWRQERAKCIRQGVWNSHLWGPLPWHEHTECPVGTFSSEELGGLRQEFEQGMARLIAEEERNDVAIAERRTRRAWDRA